MTANDTSTIANDTSMTAKSPSGDSVLPSADTPDLGPLVKALLARAPHMNFFQLCQLLESHAPQRAGFGTRDTPDHEPVRFRPFPKVGFPAAEVAAVEFDDGTGALGAPLPPTVRTTFLGLYGVDAAMPSHLIDDVVLRREGHEPVMAFLDQFNHRFVTLLYRAWKKYRYAVGFRPGGTDERSRDLLCLSGFGIGNKVAQAGLPASRVLALLGLLNQRTRTAGGLASVVALVVPGAEVKVEEFHPTWIKVTAPTTLSATGQAGGDHAGGDLDGDTARRGLGRSTVLGRRIAYRGRAVRVTLRPAGPDQAHALLPDAPLHRDLMAFLRIYVGVKADVVLRMEVSTAVLPPPMLCGAGSAIAGSGSRLRSGYAERSAESSAEQEPAPLPRLGWTTVLKPATDRVVTISLGRYEAYPKTVSRR
jgi:type VI secretion system protein ImpH